MSNLLYDENYVTLTNTVSPLSSIRLSDPVNNHSFVIYSDLTYECTPGFDSTVGGKIFAQSMSIGIEYICGIKESSLEKKSKIYSSLVQRLDEFHDINELKKFIRHEALTHALMEG